MWYRPPEILLGDNEYGAPCDLWSIGCIMAEMHNRRALFCGDSEIDQLHKIFRTLGTPNEEIWPRVTQLRDWHSSFPNWIAKDYNEIVPNMDKDALDLLKKLFIYDPTKRITAREALQHPFLRD